MLRAYGPHEASAEVGQLLAEREGLSSLLCGDGLVPIELPPNLEFLVVCLEGPNSSTQLSSVLSTVSALPHLFELKVWLSDSRVSLPNPLPSLRSLCYLTLCFDYSSDTRLHHFAALQAALAEDVYLSCEVLLFDVQFTGVRQRLWAALACVCFERLRLTLESVSTGDTASSAELRQLASVRCGELVLSGLLAVQSGGQLLENLQAAQLYCHDQYVDRDSSLAWSRLTVRAGVYVLEVHPAAKLTIDGCSATLPAFDKPWAVVVRQPQQGVVRGLPLSSFRPGPQGHLVWSNHAMTDRCLKAAYAALRLAS